MTITNVNDHVLNTKTSTKSNIIFFKYKMENLTDYSQFEQAENHWAKRKLSMSFNSAYTIEFHNSDYLQKQIESLT